MSRPATIKEIRDGCPGATSDFILAQVERAATLDQAKNAFMTVQSARLAEQAAELAALESNARRTPTTHPKRKAR